MGVGYVTGGGSWFWSCFTEFGWAGRVWGNGASGAGCRASVLSFAAGGKNATDCYSGRALALLAVGVGGAVLATIKCEVCSGVRIVDQSAGKGCRGRAEARKYCTDAIVIGRGAQMSRFGCWLYDGWGVWFRRHCAG